MDILKETIGLLLKLQEHDSFQAFAIKNLG